MANDATNELKVRLDKWLWAARLTKTRALARDLIQAGKVHYNGQKSKPGKIVEPGAAIRVPAGWDVKELIIQDVSEKRLPAKDAQLLYEETPESIAKREENQAARKSQSFHNPRPESRPDKKQRRELIKFKHQ
ncbi:MAG: ribosome-associated heat shock protein Hsp15 [Gammaproteobacteria bacterium]|uniref:Heat shock protein 15 n=1 Tax=Alteromonas oceani TaxID=2071609 RepID=A0ABV7K2E1_9ALTE|nr:ribosome-associated heat shock protein Hsp15 [Alteromonas oceani]MBR9790324.1 ribosome-associated heat shock protein Hsp15 [Gammaproteobacteria bacterium]MDG6097570.1 ribosome-associated heat shock protein Hsp15 [Alteromonas sp. ZYF713]